MHTKPENLDTSEKHVHESDKSEHVTPISEMPQEFQDFVRKGLNDGSLVPS